MQRMMLSMHRPLRAPSFAFVILLPVFLGILSGCSDRLRSAADCGEKIYTRDRAHSACIRIDTAAMMMVADGKAGRAYEKIEPRFTFTRGGDVVYIATHKGKQLLVVGTKEGNERFDYLWNGEQPEGDIQRFLGFKDDMFHWVNLSVDGTSFTEELAFASRVPDGIRIDWSAVRDPARFSFDPRKMQFAYPVFSKGGKKALMFRDGIDPFFDEVCCTQFSKDGETSAYIALNKYKAQSAVVIRDERRRKIGNWFDGIGNPNIDVPVEGSVSYEAWWNSEPTARLYEDEL